MLEIRRVEENVQTLYNDGHVRGSTHSPTDRKRYRASPSPLGRPTSSRAPRSRHGAALGVTPEGVLGNLWRSIGCVGGVGGSMHPGRHVGRAVSDVRHCRRRGARRRRGSLTRVRSTDDAAIAIFGDGSTNIGAFPRDPQSGRHPQAARRVRVREQSLRRVPRINLSTPVEHIADRAASYGCPASPSTARTSTR